MTDRPGLIQKRLSPHRFVQIPSDDAVPTAAATTIGTGTGPGPGPGPGTGSAPDDVAIDIPLSSMSGRSGLTRTGARKASTGTGRGSGSAAFCRGAYEPPGFLTGSSGTGTGVGPNEKSGLGSAYAPVHRYGAGYGYGYVCGNGNGYGNDFRRRRSSVATVRSMGEPDGSSRLARCYKRIIDYSPVTKYMVYILPLATVLAVPIIVGVTVAKHVEIGGVRLYWFFTWVDVVWLALWVSKLVARCLPSIYRSLASVLSPGRKGHAKVLRALETPVAMVLWAGVAVVTFFPIMTLNPVKLAEGDTKIKPWENSVKNILFALLICSVMFLVEKGMLRTIAVSYHRTQFKLKIKHSNRVMNLLGSLYDASRSMFPVHCQEFHEDDAIISNSIRNAAPEGKRRSPLKFFRAIGGLDEAPAWGVVDDFFGKQGYGSNAARSAVIQALETKDSAEALARRLWMSFVVEGRHALYLEDIAEVLGNDHAEAQECFRMLDRDDNGDIGLDEMILTLAEFGQERMSLNQSIHDVDGAAQILDSLLLTVVLIIGSLVSVFFVTNTSSTAITAGATAILGLCFLLATTAQEVLGSAIFLFVKRPFDVGDRVEIGATPYIVQRISLTYTVLRSVSDHRITQVPNYVLNSLFVDNFTRAHAMHELLTIPANFDTTFSDIQTLRDDLERFVRDKENRRDFKPDIDVEVAGLGNMDRLELRVDIRHKSNWSNESVRAARRSKFMCALVLALRRINIRAPAPPANESGGPTNLTPCSDDTIANNLLDSRHPQPPVNRALTVRRSLASNDHHLNPHSPVEDEETRYQTPSGSPRKRLSSNLNPGMQSASRQSSTGRRKVSSAEGLGLANGVPIITEPVPVQRPAHQMSYNPYESGARTRQQRRFSYDVDHAGNANGNGNETPGSDEKRG